MQEQIKELAAKYKEQYIAVRQHIHAHPELSYQEFNTSKYIREHLTQLEIPFEVLATTGVVGIIKGKNPNSRVVALRADMDALPILEANDVAYKSKVDGVMHACGHDVHTTCLLGAARILTDLKDEWEGTVKLIFQPGEEKNPGGASLMIKEGVLENPTPEKIFGLHVHPQMEVGTFSFRAGMVMASADELYISIRSTGGHAASPNKTADTILIACQIVNNLQQIISRNNDPFNPSVLSITAFNGGNTTNVIPSEVKLMGTFRAMNEEWRFAAHQLIKHQIITMAAALGAEAEVTIDVGYPFVMNDPDLNETAKVLAASYAGAENVSETELRMGAEDFAYYSHKIPGCFFRLGAGNKEKGISASVHTPIFNVDEGAMEQGMGMMALMGALG